MSDPKQRREPCVDKDIAKRGKSSSNDWLFNDYFESLVIVVMMASIGSSCYLLWLLTQVD